MRRFCCRYTRTVQKYRPEASECLGESTFSRAHRTSVARAIIVWFRAHARPLPWRGVDTTPWEVLVSEFMAQQTQVDRVIPKYLEWVERWPLPSTLAKDAPGEAVRAWDRLGYPRRALWLHRAATTIAHEHNDEVPRDINALLTLTGVGPYTARAVAVFAFGDRHPVVDTNTRRVLARALHGKAAAGMPAQLDLTDLLTILPAERNDAAAFNAGVMELGALVCTARSPKCGECPIAKWCRWRAAGYPANAPERRPTQAAFAGSDRQVRGRILALLRAATGQVSREEALRVAADGTTRDQDQPQRAFDSLVADGLVVEHNGIARLP